jgi:hypothetical protein
VSVATIIICQLSPLVPKSAESDSSTITIDPSFLPFEVMEASSAAFFNCDMRSYCDIIF